MEKDLLFNTPQINLSDYPAIKCSNCNSVLFEPAIIYKKIPGTLIGNGTEPFPYPIEVLVCKKCGKVLDEYIKAYKLEKDLGIESKEEKKDNLIIT